MTARPPTRLRRPDDPARPAAGPWRKGRAETGGPVQPDTLRDYQRSERSMVIVRWAGVAFAVAQVLAYRELPYPPRIREAALGLAASLAVANVAIWILYPRVKNVGQARTLAVAAFGVDILVSSGFVWLYAFDPGSALWALLFIMPLEGAIRFGLAGAMTSWGVVTVLYIGREMFRVRAYPESVAGPGGFGFQPESISFRMGIGFLIALVAGFMARNLLRERGRLADALGELSRTDALRSRLVATLAHDVRNPLTTIRGTLKTLGRHLDRLDPEVRRELIHTADRQADRLERLATELLDLARIEQGRLDLSVEDLPLAEAVRRGLSFAVEGHRFDVRIPPQMVVRADPARLEQIVVNLAGNALRYGQEPFLVEARDGEGGMVTLSFRDHGPGVPEAHRDSLFEPFRTEADGSSVGLGLAIVKALAEAQGGQVSYEPNRPRGACFRLTLPAGGS